MLDALKAVDTNLQNEADQLSPPEARYWVAEKKSKAGDDSVEEESGQHRNRTAGVISASAVSVVVAAAVSVAKLPACAARDRSMLKDPQE